MFSYQQPKREQESRAKSYRSFVHNPLWLWAIWRTPNGTADIYAFRVYCIMKPLSVSEKHGNTASASYFQLYVAKIHIYWFLTLFFLPSKILRGHREKQQRYIIWVQYRLPLKNSVILTTTGTKPPMLLIPDNLPLQIFTHMREGEHVQLTCVTGK